jgi:hypothetical protein
MPTSLKLAPAAPNPFTIDDAVINRAIDAQLSNLSPTKTVAILAWLDQKKDIHASLVLRKAGKLGEWDFIAGVNKRYRLPVDAFAAVRWSK